MPDKPLYRKLRGYAFDPSLSLQMDTAVINDITYRIPWEDVGLGPCGKYVEVIDYDPTVDTFYRAVNLQDPNILAEDGLTPSEGNPLFHQQMVYAVTMLTISNFEKALGRKITWSPRKLAGGGEEYVPRLRIYPHGIQDANAFYSPLKKAIVFGYFASTPADEVQHMPDSLVFTCLSHDIIAHETTHAILDGIHPYFNESTNPDMLAFHEAFADIIALFQHFTFPEVLRHQIAKTRGDLSTQNLLGQLAQEFGKALGQYGSLRDAIGELDPVSNVWKPRRPDPADYRNAKEPHDRGSILVAAVFEAFISIYNSRVADLIRIASEGSGILRQGNLHPDLVNRLASEASKAAQHVLLMCIRALDYCPPVDLTFGDFLRAIITADTDLVEDDTRDYRLAFIDAFRKRGIYAQGIKTLSVEDLCYDPLNIGSTVDSTGTLSKAKGDKLSVSDDFYFYLGIINQVLREYADDVRYLTERHEIYTKTKEYIAGKFDENFNYTMLGLHQRLSSKFRDSAEFSSITGLVFLSNFKDLGIPKARRFNQPGFEIQGLRRVSRVGPQGTQVNQVIFSILQHANVKFANGEFKPVAPEDETRATDAPNPSRSDNESVAPVDKSFRDTDDELFTFRGGCTLIFNLDSLKLQYAISKPIFDVKLLDEKKPIALDPQRLRNQYHHLFVSGIHDGNMFKQYFSVLSALQMEPFAFLHQT
jgi:hypothetical protein